MSDPIVVPEIYSEWPPEIKNCWVGICFSTYDNTYTAKIVRSSEYPSKEIINLVNVTITDNVMGFAKWTVQDGEAVINTINIDSTIREQGIATWFVVMLRTYVAKHMGLKIVPQKQGTPDPINNILINIAKKYSENTLEVRTKTGKIKEYGRVKPDIEL